jgi:hypothetical protein
MNDNRNMNKNDNMRGDNNLNQKSKDCSSGDCNNMGQRSNDSMGKQDDLKGKKLDLNKEIESLGEQKMDSRGMSGQMKK